MSVSVILIHRYAQSNNKVSCLNLMFPADVEPTALSLLTPGQANRAWLAVYLMPHCFVESLCCVW